MFWALRVSDGTAVFLKAFNDAAGVAMMDRARLACKERLLVCPDCDGTLKATSRSSSGARAHFKHHAGADADAACPGAARMSMAHLQAQDNIAAVLRRGHPSAKVILWAINIGEDGHAGRADIVVILPRVPALHRGAGVGYARAQGTTQHAPRNGSATVTCSRLALELSDGVGQPDPLPRKPHAQGRLGRPRLRVRVEKMHAAKNRSCRSSSMGCSRERFPVCPR